MENKSKISRSIYYDNFECSFYIEISIFQIALIQLRSLKAAFKSCSIDTI